MRTFVVVAAIALLATCAAPIASAQATSKLGFVDFEVIIKELPEFKTVESKLQTLQKSFQDTLQMIQAQYQQKLENYQKQRELMTPDARAQEEQAIGQIRDQYLQFQEGRLGQQGVYFQTQAQLLAPIRERVRGAVEKVARDESLVAVLENSLFVYYDKKFDITYKVLDYIRRGK
jgi:outer membrane protein